MDLTHYQLIDSGRGRKLEQFGPLIMDRPCSQALWNVKHQGWTPHIRFDREEGQGWMGHFPQEWDIKFHDVVMRLRPTDFGHVGMFPEHAMHLPWLKQQVHQEDRILNLFGYTGFLTLSLAKLGAHVCHVDASKKSVAWARENAALNGLEEASIRWIVDDAIKFLKREIKRGQFYHGVILDPPSFGRGPHGEVFKLEEEVNFLIELCQSVLSPERAFFLLTCHTPGLTPIALSHFFDHPVESGEMVITSSKSHHLPSGSFVRWKR